MPTYPADLEVFFKAVGLQQVGEFEGARVSASGPDFPLQIGDEGAQVLQGVRENSER